MSQTPSASDSPPLPALPPSQRRKYLLVFIHGFLGSEESFFSFPTDLAALLHASHPNLFYPGDVEVRLFPRYDTRGHNARSVQKLIDWLLIHATTGRYKCVILLAHSMGGLLAADAYQYMYALHKEKVEERLRKGDELVDGTGTKADAGDGVAKEMDVNGKAGDENPVDEKQNTGDEKKADEKAGNEKSVDEKTAETPNNTSQATIPTGTAVGVPGLQAVTSWLGSWRLAKASSPPASAASTPGTTTPKPPNATEDGFEGTDKYSPDSDVRLLVNIRGIITFDSPFYGLHASVLTQAGTNKAVALVTDGIMNAKVYLPTALETVSAYAPRHVEIPTAIGRVPVPTAWMFNATKRVIGAATLSEAAATAAAAATEATDVTVPLQTHTSLPAADSANTPAATTTPTTSPDGLPASADAIPDPPQPTSANMVALNALTSRVPPWARYALGGAAMAATAYAVAPLAIAYIPATMIASGVATSFAVSSAEHIRDHLHFLYPLVNTHWDMHQRVQMLRNEMEGRRRLTFSALYLALPPYPTPPKPAPPPVAPTATTETSAASATVQMMDIDEKGQVVETTTTTTVINELRTLPTPYASATVEQPSQSTPDPSTAFAPTASGQSESVPVASTAPANPSDSVKIPAEGAPQTARPPTPSTSPPVEPTPSNPPNIPTPKDTPTTTPTPTPTPTTPPTHRHFCNPPPPATAHLFSTMTHPYLNEIDAHMNVFNSEAGMDWYNELVQRTAGLVVGVVTREAARRGDGVLEERL